MRQTSTLDRHEGEATERAREEPGYRGRRDSSPIAALRPVGLATAGAAGTGS